MKSKGEQKVSISGKVNIWFIPWLAGWMFTLGYMFVSLDPAILIEIAELNLLAKIGFLVVVWFTWPLLWGLELGGGF